MATTPVQIAILVATARPQSAVAARGAAQVQVQMVGAGALGALGQPRVALQTVTQGIRGLKGDPGPPGVFTDADVVTQPQADFDWHKVLEV